MADEQRRGDQWEITVEDGSRAAAMRADSTVAEMRIWIHELKRGGLEIEIQTTDRTLPDGSEAALCRFVSKELAELAKTF